MFNYYYNIEKSKMIVKETVNKTRPKKNELSVKKILLIWPNQSKKNWPNQRTFQWNKSMVSTNLVSIWMGLLHVANVECAHSCANTSPTPIHEVNSSVTNNYVPKALVWDKAHSSIASFRNSFATLMGLVRFGLVIWYFFSMWP